MIGDLGEGKGYRLEVSWTPDETSPPDIERWRVRVIGEVNGVVTLCPLDEQQVRDVGAGSTTNVVEKAVVILASELAHLQRAHLGAVATLTKRINELGVEVAALRQREHEAAQPGVLRRLWERL